MSAQQRIPGPPRRPASFEAARPDVYMVGDVAMEHKDWLAWSFVPLDDEPAPLAIEYRPGNGVQLGGDERPATPKQARSVYIACGICILLLIAGFAYIAWASSNGGYRWQ